MPNDREPTLLIGVGSIGARHLRLLINRCRGVFVVDPDQNVLRTVQDEYLERVTTYRSLEVALENAECASASTAVIANWGPQHRETFDALSDAGFRRIFCEKPMASSISDAYAMASRAQSEGIRLAVGHYQRFRGLSRYIEDICVKDLGGPPQAVIVHGGAQCLITGGIHWVDLSCQIFGSNPKRVLSNARNQFINPRSPALTYWEGTAVWEFPFGQQLTISYSNSSSVAQVASIYAKDGRIDLSRDGRIYVAQRNRDELLSDARVTRLGDVIPVEVATNSILPLSKAFESQLNNLESSDGLMYAPDEACLVIEAGLAALASGEIGSAVDLPMPRTSPFYTRDWLAS